MANFEFKYIYLYIKDKAKMFLRFIDDLLRIWTDLNSMSDLNRTILRSNLNSSTHKEKLNSQMF